MRTLELSKNLFFHYESVEEVENYYGLLACWALAQTAVESGDEEVLSKVKTYLSAYPEAAGRQRFKFECYKCGGNGRAYLAWKHLWEGQEDILQEYAEKTVQSPMDRKGILCMPWNLEKEQVWIDVVTCVTPFMLYAGKVLHREDYCSFGAAQCFRMFDLFEDPRNGLLHQCRGFLEDMARLSSDHWSRGNGWGMVGLAEILNVCEKDSGEYKEAACRLERFAESLLAYQTDKGLWRQEIPEPSAYEECSGTALILYGIGVGIRCGVLAGQRVWEAYERGIRGMCQSFIGEDFTTRFSCCGCLCPGKGEKKGTPEAYLTEVSHKPDEPHSFGCLMLALVEAYRNGLVEM